MEYISGYVFDLSVLLNDIKSYDHTLLKPKDQKWNQEFLMVTLMKRVQDMNHVQELRLLHCMVKFLPFQTSSDSSLVMADILVPFLNTIVHNVQQKIASHKKQYIFLFRQELHADMAIFGTEFVNCVWYLHPKCNNVGLRKFF